MSARPPHRRAALQGRLILLVEDESLIVLDVTHALEREGARVLAASTAAQALERIETRRPDAAVLDLKLGRAGTCEPVVERLAELDVPFLVHTGDAHRQERLLERLGAIVLDKPYPSHRLADRIAELLDDGERPGDA